MKKIGILLLTLLGLTINYNSFIENGAIVSFKQNAQKDIEYRAFYTRGEEKFFIPKNSEKTIALQNQKKVEIYIPSKKIIRFRLDLGKNPGTVVLSDLKINKKKLDLAKFNKNKDIEEMTVKDNQLIIKSNAENPSITYQEILNIKKSRIIHYPILIFLTIVCFLAACGLLRFMKGRQSKVDSVFIILFGILLFIPMGKISRQDISPQENRRLARYHHLFANNQLNNQFGSQFDAFFNDRFNERDNLISFYNRVVSFVNLKPYSPYALYGKEGWLYGTAFSAVDVFQNNNLFSDQELKTIAQNMVHFEKDAKRHGVKNVYFLLNNDKESIYPEFYPESIKKVGSVSRLEQIVSYLHKNYPELKVFNFKDKYDELKKTETIFYKTGTHMNHIGSFYNYKFMADEIAKDYPDLPVLKLDDYVVSESEKLSQPGLDLDLYYAFKSLPSYPQKNFHNKILTLKNPKATRDGNDREYEHIFISVYKNTNKKVKHSAFIIGDSFSKRDIDKYKETFSTLRHITVLCGDDFNFFDSLKSETKELLNHIPEIVIVESTERFLDRLLTLNFPED